MRNRLSTFLAVFLVLALSACSAITPKLNETTGTTLEQRCADYKAGLAAAKLLNEDEKRAVRIEVYEILINTYCAGQPQPQE